MTDGAMSMSKFPFCHVVVALAFGKMIFSPEKVLMRWRF